MTDKYTKPRAVRLGELDQPVTDFMTRHGMKFSKVVKEALSGYLKKDSPNEPDPKEVLFEKLIEELKDRRATLARVGENLNQIAFHYNSTGIIHDPAIKKTHAEPGEEFREQVLSFRRIQKMIPDLQEIFYVPDKHTTASITRRI